ncbi:MAG: hypothetical protein AB3N16_10655 [Flavobacteriaceae bacterium]
MTKEEISLRLEQIGVPLEIRPVFIDEGSIQQIERNETVASIGELCQKIFIVLEGGFVSQQRHGESAHRTVNFFLDSHEPYMVSFHSFFHGEPSRVRLLAIKKSTVLILEKFQIDEFNRTLIPFKNQYIERLVHVLLVENEFKSYMITKSSQELYGHIVTDYPELVRDVPTKYIAEFMGISRVWLSNLKRRNFKKNVN